MSGYLFDTNVISELRKGQRADIHLRSWYASVAEQNHFLSVLVVGEIRSGIERLRRRDPQSAAALETWLQGLERSFSSNILPVTRGIANRWGHFVAIRPIPTVDGLLAATALEHDLVLVTRNIVDVEDCGANLLNPFEGQA
ncbi:MAG: putative nucleic acid-binding protein [Rhodothermales bacterium]|jgi:predicted nucleic acid-binding protein